jgi:uncharacterized protein (DUF1800 family)
MAYLTAFVPDGQNPFDRKKARHLMRRAGFDCTPSEADAIVALGVSQAVDNLLTFTDDEPAIDALLPSASNRVIPNYFNWDSLLEADTGTSPAAATYRDWSFFLFRYTQHALRERMLLFWHNHFVSQRGDVGSGYQMIRQLDTWRKNALPTSFKDLIVKAAQDPAMLDYLNNRYNRSTSPDENWARELMELFTTGIDQYTENDVKEMARIFTGWTRGDTDKKYSQQSYYYYFRTSYHDYDGKSLFGVSFPDDRTGDDGELDGYDAIDLCLARESQDNPPYKATAMFLGGKLMRHFVGQEVSLDAIKEMATLLAQNSYNIKEAMRTLLKSEVFYDPTFYRSEYRSPIEQVATINRLAQVMISADFRAMYENAKKMGQEFLNPPNVSGWKEGRAWLNVNNLLQRINYGYYMQRYFDADKLDPDALISGPTLTNQQMVDELIELFIGDTIRSDVRQSLIDYTIEEDADPRGRSDEEMRHRKVVKLIHLIVALPEMQMK